MALPLVGLSSSLVMYQVVRVKVALSMRARPVCVDGKSGIGEGSDVMVTHLVSPKEEGSPCKVETELSVVESDAEGEFVAGSGGNGGVEGLDGDMRRVSHGCELVSPLLLFTEHARHTAIQGSPYEGEDLTRRLAWWTDKVLG